MNYEVKYKKGPFWTLIMPQQINNQSIKVYIRPSRVSSIRLIDWLISLSLWGETNLYEVLYVSKSGQSTTLGGPF